MELYFCGNLNDQKLINKLTQINTTKNNQDLNFQNIFSLYHNITFQSQSQKLYSWNFEVQFQLSQPQNPKPNPNSNTQPQLQVDFTELTQFQSQINTQKKEIQDLKSTDLNIFSLNSEHSLSAFLGNANLNLDSQKQKLSPVYQTSFLHIGGQISRIACGIDHVIILTGQGFLYSMGNQANGRLGRGNLPQNTPKYECKIIDSLQDYVITDISAGNEHNLCIGIPRNSQKTLENSKDSSSQKQQQYVFSWGKGDYGCLGQGHSQDLFEPEKIQNFTQKKENQTIKKILCGEVHSYVLYENGDLYSFGNNEFGQLGHNNYLPCYQPSKVSLQEPVCNFFAGNFHAYAITQRSNIFSWGTGQFGQLGNGEFQIKQKEPSLVSDFASKNHIEMTLNSIQIYLFNCQTFIQLPDYDHAKQQKMTRAKNNKNTRTTTPIKKPIFPCFSQQNPSNLSNFESKTEEEQQQNTEEHTTQEKDQKTTQLQELRKAIKNDKIQQKQRVNHTFHSKTEEQEKKRKNLTLIWQNEILKNWEKMKFSDQLKDLCYQGIPPNMRDKVWFKSIKNNLSVTEDYFNVCVAKSKKLLTFLEQKKNKVLPQELIQQLEGFFFETQDDENNRCNKELSIKMIENDLSRTFPQLPIFSQDSPIQQNLREVLMAFVSARPDIGYLQGMSYVCALMILYMDKFKAFVCFTNLVTHPALMPFYVLNEEHVQQKLQLFKYIFNANLPELCEHFEKEQIQPKMYIFEWMLTLYTKNLNLDTVCRIWDLMFVQQGPIILYKVAISILKQLEQNLINEDIAGIMQIFKKTEDILDEDQLIEQTKTVFIPNWVLQEIEHLNNTYIP